MKINFIPTKLYSYNNTNNLRNRVSFGNVDEGYRATQPDWYCDDCFETHEDHDDIFQYSQLSDNESKFRNLPQKSSSDRIREMAFVNMISGEDKIEDDDFLDNLTY